MGVEMNRSEILDTAKEHINVDRADTHGDAASNFGLVSLFWSAHLDTYVSPEDVAVMMTLFKIARIKANPQHIDSWSDGCGYLALGGEIATGEG